VFLPALYAIWFRIKPVAKDENAAPEIRTEPATGEHAAAEIRTEPVPA